MAEKDLNIYFTGVAVDGDPQANPNSSLGGIRSGTMVQSISVVGLVNVTGVTIDDASSLNGPGSATLSFDSVAITLTYTAPGDSAGGAVDVSVDGTYEIYSVTTTKYLVVTVVAASLPATNQSDVLTLSTLSENLFDSVGSAEAQAGSTEYRALMVKNDSAFTMNAMIAWIDTNTPFADDSVEIAVEAPVAGAVQTIVSETTAPTGITFSTATSEVNALVIGSLASLETFGIWIKRIVNPTVARYPDNNFSITVKADTV